MGYERNDRRFGVPNDRSNAGGYGPDRGRYESHGDRYQGRDDDRARSYGGDYGRRDYRDERQGDYRDHDRARWDSAERGFFDRASDEVRSWFGDDDAERRRRRDELEAERDYRRRYGSDRPRSNADFYSDPGYSAGLGLPGAEYFSAYDPGTNYDSGRRETRPREHDQGYRSWRDRQMDAFDRDYDEYRRENQGRFESEFGQWRQQREGQRGLLARVQEHQEVVGSDGSHIGTVDHVRGDRIRLTKTDQAAGGHHHSIPSSWIQSVDDKITVSKTADQAKQHWRDEDRNQGGALGWGDDDRGRTNLNRSFSGTY
jgi:hypothetical protein